MTAGALLLTLSGLLLSAGLLLAGAVLALRQPDPEPVAGGAASTT